MKNILIIDDDPIYVFLAKKLISLSNPNSSVTVFGDGLAAINFLTEAAQTAELLPDLILLDLSMPVMDGWDFLDEYMHLHPRMQKKVMLYIVSSSISPYELERSKSYQQVADFLIKPLQKDKVMEIIEYL